ncbi:MAG: hypothetical protein GY940_30235 [bacterium]|nr:hypothetical protein [bacterium]
MKDDPIIEELREIRKHIEDECKNKNQSYFDHLQEVQEQYKDRLVDTAQKHPGIKEKSA